MKFVMVPAESLKAGDVVAVDNTPVRYAQPLSAVNVTPEYVELVFLEKSRHSDQAIRISGRFDHQQPVALITDIDRHIADTLEEWLGAAQS